MGGGGATTTIITIGRIKIFIDISQKQVGRRKITFSTFHLKSKNLVVWGGRAVSSATVSNRVTTFW